MPLEFWICITFIIGVEGVLFVRLWLRSSQSRREDEHPNLDCTPTASKHSDRMHQEDNRSLDTSPRSLKSVLAATVFWVRVAWLYLRFSFYLLRSVWPQVVITWVFLTMAGALIGGGYFANHAIGALVGVAVAVAGSVVFAVVRTILW